MRETLQNMMKNFGVPKLLSAYEAYPWIFYDEDSGRTCSAEIRMGPNLSDMEAEIQLFSDDGDDEGEGESEEGALGQIMLMRAVPSSDGMWSPKYLKIKDVDYTNKIYDWEGKGCQFFRSTVEAVLMGSIPNFDDMIDEKMQDSEKGGGATGRIGRKSPNAKNAISGMKR